MSDVLLHYGKKGMKWGVRKAISSTLGKSQNVNKAKSAVKEHVGSLVREQHWRKVARNADKMSTKDLQKVTQRIQKENELKRLTKRNTDLSTAVRRITGDKTLPNAKDRSDYRKRGTMSDNELNRKLNRLRTKEQLGKAITSASKEQMDFGKKIVKSVKSSSVSETFADPQRARDKVLKKAGFERVKR